MLLLLNVDDFKENYVILGERTANNIIQNSDFCRISYSNHTYSMNGIYLFFTIASLHTERNFNKTRIRFTPQGQAFGPKLSSIEERVLRRNNDSTTRIKHISHQMEQGVFKVSEYHGGNCFMLKISGIWMNKHECGLTYRFISIEPSKAVLDMKLLRL